MKIFNRWGELIFVTDNLDEGWNGEYKGSMQAEGTYVYVAKFTDRTNHTFERTGSFVLLHK
jgi:gliding motility-associated-like protein